MPSLLNIKQRSLFQTDVAPRVRGPRFESGEIISSEPYAPPRNWDISVDQTPQEARNTRMSNYPQYDEPSVRNLPARKRSYR